MEFLIVLFQWRKRSKGKIRIIRSNLVALVSATRGARCRFRCNELFIKVKCRLYANIRKKKRT